MHRIEHYIQDAFELRAVAELQALAQEHALAITNDASEKLAAFHRYLADRGASFSELDRSKRDLFTQLETNLETHLPSFFCRLVRLHPDESFDFINVETEARNAGRREDFVILTNKGSEIRMSLKNYKKDARKPQFGSGTFNSFVIKLLFASAGGPGMYLDPRTNKPFYSGKPAARDRVLKENGLGHILSEFERIDQLNQEVKQEFAYSDELLMYDDERFDAARKRCGLLGASIVYELFEVIGPERIRTALLTLAGLDDGDDMIVMDPERCTDTLSSSRFREIKDGANAPGASVRAERKGQSISFVIVGPDDQDLLTADVPFTINKNGCWNLSGDPYEGVRMVSDDKKKPPIPLKYGERRPFKSKQIALSVNTWVDVGRAGIFDLDEV